MSKDRSDWVSSGCILVNKKQALDDFLKLVESVNKGGTPKGFFDAAYDLACVQSFYEDPEYIKNLINTSVNKYQENKNKK